MPPNLYTETAGQGSDLFLVHGWALHGGVWSGIVPELAQQFRVTCVDLPGHGLSRALPMPATLAELALQLRSVAPKNAIWIGWSLGGLACLRAALDCPGEMCALVLVSTTPSFLAKKDWSCAMPPTQLREFVADLGRDYQNTVLRFLALQVRGDTAARGTLRQLREMVFARGEPHLSALSQGLQLLRDGDLRVELAHISLPTLVVAGEYDRLTPPQAGIALAASIPGARLVRLARASHAPFLSHPKEFVAALKSFLGILVSDRAATGQAGVIQHG